jgi:uncharacterized protein (TIGR03083 family)
MELAMSNFDTQVPIVQTEAEGLAQFLDTLSAEDWLRPSTCDLWTIRDVVAHLMWAADFYTDTVSRGVQGDSSIPADRPPGDAPDPASMPDYFHQHTLRLRDRLGADLLPRFRLSFQTLTTLLRGLSLQQWDMPCSFFRHHGSTLPAHAFLALSIQEVTIHSWDIRSPFNATATLSTASLPPLLERLPYRFRPGFATFPMAAKQAPRMHYQFDLTKDGGLKHDLIIEDGMARLAISSNEPADVTLCCDRQTFVLMMYKRLALDPAISNGGLQVEIHHPYLKPLDQWLRQP